MAGGARLPALRAVLAVPAAVFLLAAASQLVIPLQPVPLTMQSCAVVLVGALCGWRLGALAVLLWLAAAALGLPLLAGGSGGLAPFRGPTAGYLFAFPFAAALAGWLVERGFDGRRPLRAFAAMLLATLLALAAGGLWLMAARGVGAAQAILLFLPGAVLKSALAAAALVVWRRLPFRKAWPPRRPAAASDGGSRQYRRR